MSAIMDDLEHNLTKEKLSDAAGVMADLQRAFTNLQMPNDEQQRKAGLAGIACVMAGLDAIELATHLHQGMEFYEALRATVRGEMKIDSENAQEPQAAIDNLHDPMKRN